MASPAEHTHHIKIRSTQMEMPSDGRAVRDDDYDRKLQVAQEELNRIQLQREDLERKKSELEELTGRKRTFMAQQVELTEKLTSALTLVDRELYDMRQEAEDLEQCRTCFAAHLDKIQRITPENWTRENLSERLEKSSMAIDIAADEYDQAAAHFDGTRSGAIFGRPSKRARAAGRHATGSEFMQNLRNGFAFNLPIVVLGGVALLVYLAK
jgi:Asp-tRNA(Asn)/Glu-tRNA(Gln) amidotransferase B subunit